MKIIAGPCMLQSRENVELAKQLKKAGGDIFRCKLYGGGTRPPKDARGWGIQDKGWSILKQIKMPTAIEVQCLEHAQKAIENKVDYIWTAARIMQNYTVIPEIGKLCMGSNTGLMIKRGYGASFDDICGAIEYIEQSFYPLDKLWFIERGIVNIDRNQETRWRTDLLIVPQMKEKFPDVKVMVDVSHSVGRSEWVLPMAKAAKGIGADGIMVEVYDPPEKSLGDPRQAIGLKEFKQLVKELK